MTENKKQTSDKQQNGNDFIADVMSSICSVSCGYNLDADYNASLNILMKFLGTGVYSPC